MAPQMSATQVHVVFSLLQKYPMFGKYMNKYTLLPEELNLLTDAGHYRRKAALAEKVMNMLGSCAEFSREFYSGQSGILPPEAIASAPKISRGENYLGFPWMVLDYPRYFKGKDVFAIRTLCWWGNSISIALLLSGQYARKYYPIIAERVKAFPLNKELFVCVHKDAWQHHFGADNYRCPTNHHELCRLIEQSFRQNEFIKLCRNFHFNQWDLFPSCFEETQGYYLKLLH